MRTKSKKKNLRKSVKRCTICILPETFPGIKFNHEGICKYCQSYKGTRDLEEKKLKYRRKFEDLVIQYRGKQTYDAVISYSGGKDSTYTLLLMKEVYGLNVLALTFDNGFLPKLTYKNIKKITDALGLDHMFFKPRFDTLKKIFSACTQTNIYPSTTITRASTICTSCMALVKFYSLRTSLEKGIPFIIFGWSPGQIPITSSIMKNNPEIVKLMQKSLSHPLFGLLGDEIKPYFLEDRHFKTSIFFPYNISPLAFLGYDEDKIMEKIGRIGWKRPQHIDANTTNCLLNSFANVVHKEKYRFHPYVFELSKLIREGYLDRSSSLQKIESEEDPKIIEYVRIKLGLKRIH